MNPCSFIMLLLLLPWLARAQVTYQKLISSSATGLGAVALAETPDGGFVVGCISGQVIKISHAGELEWGRKLDSSGVFDVGVLPNGEVLVSISTVGDAQALMSLGPDGQMNWLQRTGKVNFLSGQLAISEMGLLTISKMEVFEKPFYVQQRDASGNLQWILKIEVPGDSLKGWAAMDVLGDSWLALAQGANASYLFKISGNGQIFWSLKISGLRGTDLGVFPNGEFFVGGSFFGSNDVVFMRLGQDGSIIWQKKLHSLTQNTGCASLNEFGEVLVRTYQGNGLAGLTKISQNGEMLWARGYPSGNFGMSRPIFTSDGGVAMLVPKPNQPTLAEIVLIKADAMGLVDGCDVPDICPAYEDVQLEVAASNFVGEMVYFSGNIDVAISPLPIEIEAFCQTVQIPLPDFEIADSICHGEHVQPMPLMNDNAQAWLWEFGAGAVPPISSEQFPQNIVFTLPGEHTVRQTVFFGGCRVSYEQVVTVLPAPVPNLGKDTLLCHAVAYQLDGTMPGNINYLWDDGSDVPVRTVFQNGTYVLKASNELCFGVDSVTVRFFNQTWPDAMDAWPADTTACQETPLILEVSVPGATAYQWSTGSDSALVVIDEPGLYELTIFFENCSLSQTFEVIQKQCSAKIYLPNVFSPNGDGINDVLIPFGKNAIFENMKIFDRWGSMVYNTGAPLSGWDGHVNGKPANIGVYVVLIGYTDTFSGMLQNFSSEVLLVR